MKKRIYLACSLFYMIFISGCEKFQYYHIQESPVSIKTPSIISDSYTSIIATRKDASVEISLKYFDPAYFYKERNYTVYPDHYEVYLSGKTCDDWVMIRTIDKSYIGKSFTITGLRNNELYYVYLKEINSKGQSAKNTNVAVFVPSAYRPQYNLILKDYYGHDLYSFGINPNNNMIVYATPYYAYEPGKAAAAIIISEYEKAPRLVDTRCWFPDFNSAGTKIIYSSEKGSKFDGNIMPEHITLYDINSKQSVRLTSGYSENKRPVWSPDNSWIAFSSSEGITCGLRITIINPETNERKSLDKSLNVDKNILAYSQEQASWSADGKYIYFTHLYFTNDNILPGYYDIYRISSNGGIPEPVFNTGRIECEPAISPDNSRLAFLTDLNGQLQLWIYNFNDKKFTQPFDTNVYEFSETWSELKWKDNNTIFFTAFYSFEIGADLTLFSISVE